MVKKIDTSGASDAVIKGEDTSGAAALADLERQAQANSSQASAEAQAKPVDDGLERDLLDALKMAQGIARHGLTFLQPDEFEALWGDATMRAIAGPGAEIMRRHGITVGGLMSKYGPYIALAGALVPPSLATVQLHRQRVPKDVKEAPKAPAPEGAANG